MITRFAEAMTTTIEVTLPASQSARAYSDSVFGLFRAIETRMSEWRPGSPLTAVNEAAGKGGAPVPLDLLAVVEKGAEIGHMTGGAFDISWAALWGLWDFKAETPVPPPIAERRARAKLVDYTKVSIDRERSFVSLPEAGMKIGLGGIAKGHALGEAAAYLRSRGVETFLLSAGGQVYAGGRKGDGSRWSIGVRDPRGTPDDFFAIIDVEDRSLSTSGDYESFFVHDGIRYHHILDPRTGDPARGLRSATVLADDATLADALSTALLVMGLDAGLDLVERLPGIEALVVDDSARVYSTSGLADAMRIVHKPAP
ncbi:MAG: FAD:protein FMN transferase [Gemmatimonadetes bacterium]|nr:FAD:protein FMN transferase [Gemmatimonadota bacterium]